jgi:hypothetical protein
MDPAIPAEVGDFVGGLLAETRAARAAMLDIDIAFQPNRDTYLTQALARIRTLLEHVDRYERVNGSIMVDPSRFHRAAAGGTPGRTEPHEPTGDLSGGNATPPPRGTSTEPLGPGEPPPATRSEEPRPGPVTEDREVADGVPLTTWGRFDASRASSAPHTPADHGADDTAPAAARPRFRRDWRRWWGGDRPGPGGGTTR